MGLQKALKFWGYFEKLDTLTVKFEFSRSQSWAVCWQRSSEWTGQQEATVMHCFFKTNRLSWAFLSPANFWPNRPSPTFLKKRRKYYFVIQPPQLKSKSEGNTFGDPPHFLCANPGFDFCLPPVLQTACSVNRCAPVWEHCHLLPTWGSSTYLSSCLLSAAIRFQFLDVDKSVVLVPKMIAMLIVLFFFKYKKHH